MDVALVTGVESSIGLSICQRLVSLGYRVWGLANIGSKIYYSHKDFVLKFVDQASPESVEAALKELQDTGTVVHTFVPVAYRPEQGSFAEASPESIRLKLRTEFEMPMRVLRLLQQGLIDNHGQVISFSLTGKNAIANACNAAWQCFYEAFFNEVRDYGVRVSSIAGHPNDDFKPTDSVNEYNTPQSVLNPELVADAVERLVRQGPGNLITHMEIRPQATKESIQLPKVDYCLSEYQSLILPEPKNMPVMETLIPTPEPYNPKEYEPFREPRREPREDKRSSQNYNKERPARKPRQEPQAEQSDEADLAITVVSEEPAAEPKPQRKPRVFKKKEKTEEAAPAVSTQEPIVRKPEAIEAPRPPKSRSPIGRVRETQEVKTISYKPSTLGKTRNLRNKKRDTQPRGEVIPPEKS